MVLTRLKRQIKIGTEERGAEFGHEFFDRVAFGPETFGAEVARQARFVRGPVRCLVREGGYRSSLRRYTLFSLMAYADRFLHREHAIEEAEVHRQQLMRDGWTAPAT